MHKINHQKYVSLYHRATYEQRLLGTAWYPNAQKEIKNLAAKYRLSLETIAGVTAAISPGLNWDINLKQAEMLLYDRLATVGVYGRKNRDKAIRILSGEKPLDVLGGAKVRSFYLALCGLDVPVIDRHLIRAIRSNAVENDFKPKERLYLKYAEALIKAAKILNQKVTTVQATIWLVVRDERSI